jgi:ABC-type sugar transport system ATPase subunit
LDGGKAVIAVELRDLSKSYGQASVLRDVNLTVEAGTFTVIYGPPACGKSVLVRLLTGLEKPSTGQIFLRGAEAAKLDPGKRNIGYVPQSFALYPHFQVHENIAYPLSLMKVPKSQIEPTVRQVAEQLQISPLLGKHPDQLSGGEKQRVALARGIIKHTEIYVLDDPLTGLDFKLREQLFDDLKEMQESLEATFVYTTSDPLETLALADQVAILDGGTIVEAGPIERVYWEPQHVRTMELLGFPPSNRLAGHLDTRSGHLWCQTSLFEFPAHINQPTPSPSQQQTVDIVIRPQDIVCDVRDQEDLLTCRAEVMLREDLGGEVIVHLAVDRTSLITVVPHAKDHTIAEDVLTIGVRPSAVALFAPETGQRIGQGVPSHV